MKKFSTKTKDTGNGAEVCTDCGQKDCSSEESCCGSCGQSAFGSHGNCKGHGKHKMFLGTGLVLLGILWYLKNTNVIPAIYFWPIVFVVAGLGLIGKSKMMSHG